MKNRKSRKQYVFGYRGEESCLYDGNLTSDGQGSANIGRLSRKRAMREAQRMRRNMLPGDTVEVYRLTPVARFRMTDEGKLVRAVRRRRVTA